MSTLLERDHSWAGLLRALIVFVPIYWTWVGTSIQTNQADTSRPLLRLRIFVVALAAVFMALALPQVYGRDGLVFAAAYWIGRLVLGAPLLRRSGRGRAIPVNPYSVSMVITGPLLVVGALLHGVPREPVWGAAAVLDLATPAVLRARLRGMRFDAAHLAERFGLFVLIALGESVVAVGTSAPSQGLGVARHRRSRRPSRSAAGCGGSTSTAPRTRCGTRWPRRRCSSTSPVRCCPTATCPSSPPLPRSRSSSDWAGRRLQVVAS